MLRSFNEKDKLAVLAQSRSFTSLFEGSGMSEVYIIDDEEDLLFLVRAHIEREGYTAWTFGSGRDLLAHLSQRQSLRQASGMVSEFVVLCDYRLPDMNGVEILRAVQKEAGLCGFALLSGYSGVQVPEEQQGGCAPLAVFEKPVKMEAVIEFIKSCNLLWNQADQEDPSAS